MKCPHCGIAFHDNWVSNRFTRHNEGLRDKQGFWRYRNAICPECKNVTIEIGQVVDDFGNMLWAMIYPCGINRGPVPQEVPEPIAQDYIDACKVLPISAKASAALSRRCLQHMLRSHDYKARDLAHEIDLLFNETDPFKALPLRLRQTIDGIRHLGNFAAHPNENKATLEIIDVEPHEAEWCLEVIEELFEHFYVGPAVAKAKRDALNAKLTSGGKPPAK